MSFLVFCAVLCAAFLHAGWNALVKTANNPQTGMLLVTLCHAGIGICFVLFYPLPKGEVWVWLLASGLIHMCYQLFLGFAYEKGDLSRVYPLARGGAPIIVLIVSVILGIDTLGGFELVGILMLGIGILLMTRGILTSEEDRKLLPFVLGSACATAAYSLVDGMGARVMGDAIAYVSWLLILSAAFYTPVILMLHGRSILPDNIYQVKIGLTAGTGSFAAYAIVVWAMTQAPIALVSALRESSILFAMVMGWLLFKDKMDAPKIIAGIVIVCGVLTTRV